MATDLMKALESVHFSSQQQSHGDNKCIDAYLTESRPRKRARKTFKEIQKDLEEEFLKPSTRFSTEWLNKLQESVKPPLYALFLKQFTEDGKLLSSIASYLNSRLHKAAQLHDSLAKVSKER